MSLADGVILRIDAGVEQGQERQRGAAARLGGGDAVLLEVAVAPMLRQQVQWLSRLGDAVRTGKAVVAIDDPSVLAFWTHLTPMIARMNAPVAAQAVRELGLAEGAPSLLDVGGGMVGPVAHRPLQFTDRLGPTPLKFQTLAEVEVGLHEPRPQPAGPPEVAGRRLATLFHDPYVLADEHGLRSVQQHARRKADNDECHEVRVHRGPHAECRSHHGLLHEGHGFYERRDGCEARGCAAHRVTHSALHRRRGGAAQRTGRGRSMR